MKQDSTPAVPPPPRPDRLVRWLPWLVLGCVVGLCIFGIAAYALLNATGIITTKVNLFGSGTPTRVALETTTPFATFAPAPATPAPPLATPTPAPTGVELETPTLPGVTAEPTDASQQEFLAWQANFGSPCDLFEGDNEVRKYGCRDGAYVMENKQATTRYTYYSNQYDDGVLEAEGHWDSGGGKYEYGVVFRADEAGTLYYVFTVTNDGRYNVAVYQDQKYTDLIPYTASDLVNTGSVPNKFRVVARGPQLDFYLNDAYVGGATNSTISAGYPGLFFYNDQPEVAVTFDKLSFSTFNPPTPAPPTDVGLLATPTDAQVQPALTPNVETTATPGDAVAPGIYVTGLRFSPAVPRRTQPVTFAVTFLNTTGRAQSFKWSVEIWENDPSVKKSFGIADGKTNTIPTGSHVLTTEDSWKVGGGGPCMALRARVIFQDDQGRRVPFLRPNGADLWVPFQVCA